LYHYPALYLSVSALFVRVEHINTQSKSDGEGTANGFISTSHKTHLVVMSTRTISGKYGSTIERANCTMRKRELEAVAEELECGGTLDLIISQLNNLNDLNGSFSCAVAGCHICVKSADGTAARKISNLFVHVVCTSAAVVSQQNAKILHSEDVLLMDPVDSNNLTSGLLDLPQPADKIPEPAFGKHVVLSKNAHPVENRVRLLL